MSIKEPPGHFVNVNKAFHVLADVSLMFHAPIGKGGITQPLLSQQTLP